jgi:hypothetical protein
MDKKKLKGFTFLEVILYLAIATIVVGIFFAFGWNIVIARVKSATCRETHQGAILVAERLKRELRMSESIDRGESVFGEVPGKIVFDTPAGPVTIESVDDRVRIKRGSSDPVYLSGDNMKIRNFLLEDSKNSEDETTYVGFSFDAEAYYPDAQNRQEYQCAIPEKSGVAPRNR